MSAGPAPGGVEWYGLISVTAAGQITVPVQAQEDLDLRPSTQVVAFGELDTGRLILAPPPPGGPLLEFTTDQARARRKRKEST